MESRVSPLLRPYLSLFLLIPSEGHETEADTLRQMVREVNDTQLALNEILSYHVYRYSHQTGKIAIAA